MDDEKREVHRTQREEDSASGSTMAIGVLFALLILLVFGGFYLLSTLDTDNEDQQDEVINTEIEQNLPENETATTTE